MPKNQEWKEYTTLQRKLYRELYKKDFHEFVLAFWECIEDRPLVDGVVVQYYCEMAEYLCRQWIPSLKIAQNIELPDFDDSEDVEIIDIRGDKRNICINIPPRHSKSVILNILLSVWIWLWKSIDVAAVSHNQRLAGRMNAQKQKLMNSEKFKFFFPEIVLVQNTTFSLRDSRGGEIYSVPMNAMLGHGFDLCLIDDLTNAETARKDKEEMNNAWNFYRNTLPSRANDISTAVILNIQQRLSTLDITGRIMDDSELASQYKFIVLPAIFEVKTVLVFPISGKVVTFEKEDCLWSERFGDYSSLRAQTGESVFQTEYLQKPVASEDTVVKENMIVVKSITEVPSIDQAENIYGSHDLTFTASEASDFAGGVVGYTVGANLYIKSATEEKRAFVATLQYVEALDTIYPGIIQIIEEKANGAAVLDDLQAVVPGMQSYNPGTSDKKQRLEGCTPFMISGNVIFIADEWDEQQGKYVLNEGMRKLVKELLAFPLLVHDDVTDAYSQLVNFVFRDKRYKVYLRCFDQDLNVYRKLEVQEPTYTTVFFNKEGDNWKACEIGIEYGATTRLFVEKETHFKASQNEGLDKLKEFAPDKNVFIDCSASEAMYGLFKDGITIERYVVSDFERSVSDLTMAFSNRQVIIEKNCKTLMADIGNFKYKRTKDENQMEFRTKRDGMVACLRVALKYFGGIVY